MCFWTAVLGRKARNSAGGRRLAGLGACGYNRLIAADGRLDSAAPAAVSGHGLGSEPQSRKRRRAFEWAVDGNAVNEGACWLARGFRRRYGAAVLSEINGLVHSTRADQPHAQRIYR